MGTVKFTADLFDTGGKITAGVTAIDIDLGKDVTAGVSHKGG
jgi:hypothetical protein